MSGEQYFTASPTSPSRERTIDVTLAGRPLTLTTSSGTFSPERLDTGTAVLLASVPPPPQHGVLLDLGCGWGPVAISLALQAPDAAVRAVDVNERALESTRQNARRAGVVIEAASPEDTPRDLRYAVIWSNPPIRIGKQALHELLATWLPRLDDGASAWLVVARSLGADSLERWIAATFGDRGFTVARRRLEKGYRVLEVRRAGIATSPE